jgi:hypothetical protein
VLVRGRRDVGDQLVAAQLPAEMLEHAHRHDLDRVQQPSGGLQEDDVQSHGQPVQRRPPCLGTGQLVGLEREQVLDLERRRRIGEPIPSQIPVLPAAHRTPPGARYTGLIRQPRESRKIDQPDGLHEASHNSSRRRNGFATVTFCTTVTSSTLAISRKKALQVSDLAR